MIDRIVIIADDFTGACDTGVHLAGEGAPSPVYLWDAPGLGDTLSGPARLVIDTESRHLDRDAAAERVASVAESLCESMAGGHRDVSALGLYKKIDSTLRGNIGAELEALRRAFPERIVVIAPAFPAAGRTTVDGICLVDGVSVERTEFAGDLRSRARSSRIADVVAEGPHPRRITLVKARELAEPAALLSLTPGDMVVVDATAQDELVLTATAVRGMLGRSILVGSAGFAEALADSLSTAPAADSTAPGMAEIGLVTKVGGPATATARLSATDAASRPVLGLVGSRSVVARRQVERLRDAGVAVLTLPRLRGGDASSQLTGDFSRLSTELRRIVRNGEPVVVASAGEADGAGPQRVSAALGTLARVTAEAAPDLALFATGGDTAVAVVRALDADGVLAHREVEPGIPLLSVTHRSRSVPLVTKAGGFGDEESMVRAFRMLKGGG